MSYHWHIQHINQLLAMGAYNVPMTITTIPFHPPYIPIHNLQPAPVPWSGNVIEVSESDEDEDNDVNERTLFCSNLHKNITVETLYELFLQAGPIQKVHIPKDKSGKSRLFGFVTYKYRSSPQYAMELFQGLALYGRRLKIKIQGTPKNFCGRN